MKTKKIALLSFLACACLVGGAVGFNANSVSADASVVTMRAGASLRVPVKGADAKEDKDGIKFRAYFDIEEVGKLEGAKSVGMFIAPASYYEQAPINEVTCFGAEAVYCWGGAAAGKTQIVHVNGYAYKNSEDPTVLTMDASLWNLKDTSLDKEFVGVAYLQAGDSYYFAEPAYATPVSVAQKALLNANDTIYHIEGDEEAPTRVEKAYITPYLTKNPKVTYTENVWKQQKSGEYSKVSEEKTVALTSWNQVAEVEAPAGYTAYDAKNVVKTLMLAEENVVDAYFNYSANRVVIWDGDEHVADSSYMQRTAGQDLIGTHLGNGMYEGTYANICGVQGWDGPGWTGGFVLPAATDTLSMIVRVPSETFSDWQLYRDNKYTPKTYSVQNLEDGTTNEYSAPFDLAKGLYKITMTWADSFTTIKEFVFKATTAVAWHLDNICAENIKVVGTTEVPHVFNGTLTFPAPAVIDTTVWDGEKSDLTPPVVKYKANNAGDYSTITAKDGVYTITPDASAYKYEIVVGDQSYTTVNGVSLVNFNDPIEERGYIGVTASSAYGKPVGNAQAEGGDAAIQIQEIGGKKALCINQVGAWLYANKKQTTKVNGEGKEYSDDGKDFEEVAGFVPTKVGVWVYATVDMKLDAYTYGVYNGASTTQYAKERNVPITAGYNYVEYTFNKTLEGTYCIGFGMGAAAKQCYIFEFVLIP